MILRALFAACLMAGMASADTAGGRAFWILPGEPDLAAESWVDLSLIERERHAFSFRLDHRLTIEKPDRDFAFRVTDLRYRMQLAWSRPARSQGRWWLGLVQQGRQHVDAPGQAWVQAIAAGYETDRWRVAAGPVLDERAVSAGAWFEGELHATVWRSSARTAFELDVETDGLIDGGRVNADLLAGPRIVLFAPGDRAASFMLHYRRSRNPLGLDKDALILGFGYEERPPAPARGVARSAAPEIDGRVQAGAGEGRVAGRLRTRFVSPSFGRGVRVVFDLDGNALTGDDTDELYYLYHLGVEQPLAGGHGGVYYYHRSNHQLSHPNDTVTSINVLEVGWEHGWSEPLAADELFFDHGTTLRVGWLATSSFGEHRRWHARGAARLRVGPVYGEVGVERGDIERDWFTAGLLLGRGPFLEVEYRSDEQLFGMDRRALLILSGYRF